MDYKQYKAGMIPEGIDKDKMKHHRQSELYYLTKDMFRSEMDMDPDKKIIGYTYLKEVKADEECNKLIVEGESEIKYLKYEPLKAYENLKLWQHIKGYAVLEDGNFVAVVGFPILLLLLFLMLFLLAVSFLYEPDTKPGLKFEEQHAIEAPEEREAYTETIDIPGYQHINLTENKKTMQLINPEGNTVYFMYVITEGDEEIHRTDAILPGNSVMLDLWSKLEEGDHNLTLSILTFDVDTEESCNGTAQDVTVTVQK